MVLTYVRSFHYWHEHHLQVSLALLIGSGIAIFAGSLGLLANSFVEIPAELEHILGQLTAAFFASYLLLISVGKILARWWPPPIVPLVTLLPEPADRLEDGSCTFRCKDGSLYTFRFATHDDLPHFGALAMSDPAIVLTYSYLSEREWNGVYDRWYELQRENLMVVEYRERAEASSRIAAVSIVVPLSDTGARELWTGKIGTIDLTKEHTCSRGHRPSVLLLDLMASDRRILKRSPDMIFCLPKLHIAQHWSPARQRKIEIWIEPVHRALPKILDQMGFEGPHKTGKHTLYKLSFPMVSIHLSTRQKQTSDRLVNAIEECAKWHVD